MRRSRDTWCSWFWEACQTWLKAPHSSHWDTSTYGLSSTRIHVAELNISKVLWGWWEEEEGLSKHRLKLVFLRQKNIKMSFGLRLEVKEWKNVFLRWIYISATGKYKLSPSTHTHSKGHIHKYRSYRQHNIWPNRGTSKPRKTWNLYFHPHSYEHSFTIRKHFMFCKNAPHIYTYISLDNNPGRYQLLLP